MNVRASYLAMIKAFPGGMDAMSAALGFTRDGLRNRIYETRGQRLHVETALEMQELSQTDYFAEAVAVAAGGAFVKLPCVEHIGNEEISDKFHEVFEGMGALSQEFREATKDGCIDVREKQRINNIVDGLNRSMNELRALTFKVYCTETAAATKAKAQAKRGAK